MKCDKNQIPDTAFPQTFSALGLLTLVNSKSSPV